jgi:hypothetical protein
MHPQRSRPLLIRIPDSNVLTPWNQFLDKCGLLSALRKNQRVPFLCPSTALILNYPVAWFLPVHPQQNETPRDNLVRLARRSLDAELLLLYPFTFSPVLLVSLFYRLKEVTILAHCSSISR